MREYKEKCILKKLRRICDLSDIIIDVLYGILC